MSKLVLFYPTDVFHVNQAFGANPQYYAKFHDAFGTPIKGHDGIDIAAKHGDIVRAAHDGFAHYEKDSHGGEGIGIRSLTSFDYPVPGGQVYFITMYWHLIGNSDPKYKSPIPTDGKEYPVKVGDIIGYANNTGAPFESTGDHLHFGLFPIDGPSLSANTVNLGNGFNGRIDPNYYFNGVFARDYVTWYNKMVQLIPLLQKLVEYYKSLKTK